LLFSGTGGTSENTLSRFYKSESKDIISMAGKANSPGITIDCLTHISEWERSEWMPGFADRKLKAMMGQRCLMFSLLQTHSNTATLNSIVDTDILPNSTLTGLAYLPRGAQLGIFSPLPVQWLYNFKHPWSFFYTVVPLEALLLYLGMVALIVWLFQSRQWAILIPVYFACMPMTIYGASVPFLGALYRYRYPWWMLLICLGLAASITHLMRSQLFARKISL
jgi:hypothetical protein